MTEWNDVLHFTAVHPSVLFNNLQKVGFDAKELVWQRSFKVPITLFNSENTIACLYKHNVRLVPDARDFQLFDPSKMSDYAAIPQETIEYYEEQFKLNKRPLFFHYMPHILFNGTVDISRLEIIDLN